MADVFTPSSCARALRGKSLLFLGDSIMRNIYKDLVYLLSSDTKGRLIPKRYMCAKGEDSFMGDRLVKGSKLSAARAYKEERDWYNREMNVQLTFKFITRCYDHELAKDLRRHPDTYGSFPDFIIINSALWDINRWGPSGISLFKDNIKSVPTCFSSLFRVNLSTMPEIQET